MTAVTDTADILADDISVSAGSADVCGIEDTVEVVVSAHLLVGFLILPLVLDGSVSDEEFEEVFPTSDMVHFKSSSEFLWSRSTDNILYYHHPDG